MGSNYLEKERTRQNDIILELKNFKKRFKRTERIN